MGNATEGWERGHEVISIGPFHNDDDLRDPTSGVFLVPFGNDALAMSREATYCTVSSIFACTDSDVQYGNLLTMISRAWYVCKPSA